MKRTKWQTMVHIAHKLEWLLPLKAAISYVLHNRQFLFHWWHMLFIKCAYENKHVSITDLLKVLSLFHQHASNRIDGVMVNVFASWSHHLTKNDGLGPATFYWSAYSKWTAMYMYIGVSNLPLSTIVRLYLFIVRTGGIFVYEFHLLFPCLLRGRRGRDRMVVGFTTTRPISAYHH